jgi:hypothetical protein
LIDSSAPQSRHAGAGRHPRLRARHGEKVVDAGLRRHDGAASTMCQSLRRLVLKQRHANIPWSKVAGIGNILRHEYAHVAYDLIWRVVHDELPKLETVCPYRAGLHHLIFLTTA